MNSDDPIDTFILDSLARDPERLTARTAAKFKISRQAAARRVAKLRERGLIEASGTGRGRRYKLVTTSAIAKTYALAGLSEDTVWTESVAPVVADLPVNVRGIWQYAVTELVNNAIDHSGGTAVEILVHRTAPETFVEIKDDGIGIYKKISDALQLHDMREAILELAKGKFTTDPANHTGEGLFFSSKALDYFCLSANGLALVHVDGGSAESTGEVLIPEADSALARAERGTKIAMSFANNSTRELQAVFDKFAEPDEYTFAKTIVPVKLAQHEGDKLVSRSQAKRLTARFEKFRNVVLDFEGVEEIGQAFADEVFRVFQSRYPGTLLAPVRMTPAVEKMVKRAQFNLAEARAAVLSAGDGPDSPGK